MNDRPGRGKQAAATTTPGPAAGSRPTQPGAARPGQASASPRQDRGGSRGRPSATGAARRPGAPARPGGGPGIGPLGRSWHYWRQVATIVLLGILALSGIAAIALSSAGLVTELALAALIVALVVVVGITRASR